MGTYLVAAGLVGLAIVLGFVFRTLNQIHVLVNSRLTEALNDITALKQALTDERRKPMKGRR